jgi:hypothetical protein
LAIRRETSEECEIQLAQGGGHRRQAQAAGTGGCGGRYTSRRKKTRLGCWDVVAVAPDGGDGSGGSVGVVAGAGRTRAQSQS